MSLTPGYYRLTCLCVMTLAGCGGIDLPRQGDLVMRDGQWVRTAAPAEGSPAGELSLVRFYLEKGLNGKAVDAAQTFLKRYPDDERGEEVLMLAAQAQYNRDRYMDAYALYEEQLDKYPAGDYFDRCIAGEMNIAEAFLQGRKQVVWGILYLSATDEAIEMLTRVADHAPGSDHAQQALVRIADYYYDDKRYARAVEAYDNYLELFAKGNWAAYAMFRSAGAARASFRGVVYDDTPLIEAELRFKRLAESYPAAAAEAGVEAILDEISSLRAHKDFHTAAFYERLGQAPAAKFYYQQVITLYKQTRWADKSADALKRLAAHGKSHPACERSFCPDEACLQGASQKLTKSTDLPPLSFLDSDQNTSPSPTACHAVVFWRRREHFHHGLLDPRISDKTAQTGNNRDKG